MYETDQLSTLCMIPEATTRGPQDQVEPLLVDQGIKAGRLFLQDVYRRLWDLQRVEEFSNIWLLAQERHHLAAGVSEQTQNVGPLPQARP